MYGLKTLTKQSQTESHFINMDIKFESMALVTVVNICQLVLGARGFVFVAKLSQLRYKKKRNPLAPRVQLM